MSIPLPLAGQFPLIARPNSSYAWSFLPDSFSVPDAQLAFSVSGLPSWAAFDPATRSFSGTPSPADVNSTTVTVSASSPDGQFTASSDFTLLVSPSPPPSLNTPLAAQFASSALSSPNSPISSAFALNSSTPIPALRVPPAWSFSIGLAPASDPSSVPLFYAARQPDGAPLPSWLVFSNTSLTFGGVTPGDPAQPYYTDVQLLVSDVWGFSAASELFRIELSAHDIALAPGGATLNLTEGQPFSLPLAQAVALTVDGSRLPPANVSAIALLSDASLPSWLAFDASSATLTGTAPTNAPDTPVLVPVNITTSYPAPSVLTNLSIALFPSYFVPQASITSVDAIPGQPFSYSVAQLLSNASTAPGQLSASFSPPDLDAWLSLSSNPPTLIGTPPLTLPYQSGNVTLSATSLASNTTSLLVLPLSLSPSSSFSSTASSTSNPTLTSGARTALIVLGSLAATMALILLLACYVRRRSSSQSGRVRKSLIGKAYVLEQGDESPQVPDVGKELLNGSSATGSDEKSARLSVLSAVDELGRMSGETYDGLIPQRPAPAHPRAQTSPTAWWARIPLPRSLSSPSVAGVSKSQISRPIPRVSRGFSVMGRGLGGGSRVRPHPGMSIEAPRGILIRPGDPASPSPSPFADPAPTLEEGGVRFVPPASHPSGRPDSWTPPPSLLPTPGFHTNNPFEGLQASSTTGATASDGEGGGYYQVPRTYMTPEGGSGSLGSGESGESGRGGANPFFHARRAESNPFRREGSSLSSVAHSRTMSSSVGEAGPQSERPVRRRDFGGAGVQVVEEAEDEEGEEEEGEGETEEGEETEEEAVIVHAERVSGGDSLRSRPSQPRQTVGWQGAPRGDGAEAGQAGAKGVGEAGEAAGKRPRLVAFTSERKGDVASGRRLASHKALVTPSAPNNSTNNQHLAHAHGFRYVSSASLARQAGAAGEGVTSPSVGSAVIWDGSVSTGLGSAGSGQGSGSLRGR